MKDATVIKILYATMTGSAETAAREIAAELAAEGTPHRVINMKNAGAETVGQGDTILIVTSTYGDGMVPDPAIPYYETLCADRPSMAGVKFAVFGLGDRKNHSATYNYGGKRFDELFESLGATRLAERHQHDSTAGIYIDEAAIDWIAGLAPKL